MNFNKIKKTMLSKVKVLSAHPELVVIYNDKITNDPSMLETFGLDEESAKGNVPILIQNGIVTLMMNFSLKSISLTNEMGDEFKLNPSDNFNLFFDTQKKYQHLILEFDNKSFIWTFDTDDQFDFGDEKNIENGSLFEFDNDEEVYVLKSRTSHLKLNFLNVYHDHFVYISIDTSKASFFHHVFEKITSVSLLDDLKCITG